MRILGNNQPNALNGTNVSDDSCAGELVRNDSSPKRMDDDDILKGGGPDTRGGSPGEDTPKGAAGSDALSWFIGSDTFIFHDS